MMRPLDTDEFWDSTVPPMPIPELPAPASEDTRSANARRLDADWHTIAPTLMPPPGSSPVHASKPFPEESPAQSLAHPAVTRRLFDHSAVAWLAVGFVSGMISWHAVGFWNFVTETVLHEHADATAIAVTQPAGADIVTGSISPPEPPPADCVALVQMTPAGRTAALPCATAPRPLRDAGRNPRADRLATSTERLQSTAAWPATSEPKTTSEPGTTAEPNTVASTTAKATAGAATHAAAAVSATDIRLEDVDLSLPAAP